MNFRYEKNLRDFLFQNVRSLFKQDGNLLIRKEVPVGNCIPDLIIALIPNPKETNYFSKKLTYKQASLVRIIGSYSRISIPKLSKKAFETVESVRHTIHSLEENGYIKSVSNNSYSVSNEFKKTNIQIFSIETKLTRWQNAIDQAIQYRNFSNRSFIALDKKISDRSKKIAKKSKKEGLGLMTVTKKRAYIHSNGRINKPKTAFFTYLKSSILSYSEQSYWEPL